MDNILSLNKVTKSDIGSVGFKAVDLAQLSNKKFAVPVCFVIKNSLFDDFVDSNNLRPHIERVLKETDYSSDESLEKAYEKIKEMFLKLEFSEEVKNELVEAYETLAIDMDHLDIAKLVTTIEKPFLTIAGSPNYIDNPEDNSMIFHNVRGKKSLFKTVKRCWVSLYTPESLKYRKQNSISTREKTGIIVQRMVNPDISAQTYITKNDIIVKSFYGYQDYAKELGKDIARFSHNLELENTDVNVQEYYYQRDMKDSTLVKKSLKDKGEKQKLDDRTTQELSRLTKKAATLLENPIKLFFSLSKGKIYLLLANKITKPEPKKTGTDEIERPAPPPVSTDSEEMRELEKDPDADEDSLQMEEVELEDDIAFLEKIEEYEDKIEKKTTDLSEQKKSDEEPEKPVVQEQESSETEEGLKNDNNMDNTDWTSAPKKEEEDMSNNNNNNIEQSDMDEQTEQDLSEEITKKVVPEDDEDYNSTPQKIEDSEDVLESFSEEPEEQKAPVFEPEDKSKDEPEAIEPELEDDEESQESSLDEEEGANMDEDDGEDGDREPKDEFIFSQFGEKEEDDGEEKQVEPEDGKLEQEVKPDKQERETQTQTSAVKSKKGKINEAFALVKEIVSLSYEAVWNTLKKKHLEILDSEAESFESAIEKLQGKISVPFIPEINKIKSLKDKADVGEEIEPEEAAMALRTAKNFRSILN